MLDDGSGQARGELPWPRLAPGTEVAGFIIEGLLAAGSFGTVYRAKRGERPFAIKLVPIDPRGDREVDALRRMRHPNAVCFHGYGLWPDEKPRFLVLALELVEGRPLDVWAEEENPSALELVIQVLLPLALTLGEIHAAGVVHRDIKEANIIVREADGQPVLVDFGAADYEGARRLTMRLPPGTPEYRSPEALRFAREWEGEPYPSGPGDDLWAMGVVTYWLLTRTLPFGDRNSSGMVHTILHETPPAPHELNPRVPPALGELCMRMLEKEPEARYADAKALAEALSTEWARADRSWRVPLFPEGSRDKRPAPAAHAPARQAPGRWPVAGLVLATVLAGLSAQRPELPPPPPPQQASPRQELAPTGLTGEVVRGAQPEKSPTPAPVASATNNEDPKMTKPKKTRALIVASCVAGSAGCVSGPPQQVIIPQESQPPRFPKPPKWAKCSPEAEEGHRRIGIVKATMIYALLLPFDEKVRKVTLSEGDDVTAELIGDWGELPSRTPLYGKVWFEQGYVYGRLTRARLPDGEMVPICMELMTTQGSGLPMRAGSTTKKAVVNDAIGVRRANPFE